MILHHPLHVSCCWFFSLLLSICLPILSNESFADLLQHEITTDAMHWKQNWTASDRKCKKILCSPTATSMQLIRNRKRQTKIEIQTTFMLGVLKLVLHGHEGKNDEKFNLIFPLFLSAYAVRVCPVLHLFSELFLFASCTNSWWFGCFGSLDSVGCARCAVFFGIAFRSRSSIYYIL